MISPLIFDSSAILLGVNQVRQTPSHEPINELTRSRSGLGFGAADVFGGVFSWTVSCDQPGVVEASHRIKTERCVVFMAWLRSSNSSPAVRPAQVGKCVIEFCSLKGFTGWAGSTGLE